MKRFVSLFVSVFLTAFGVVWFSQNSINAYWQQTYHQTGFLERFSHLAWWHAGADFQERAYQALDDVKNRIASANEKLAANQRPSENIAAPVAQQPLALSQIPSENLPQNTQSEVQQVILKKGQKVFFAGDSLMQAVAPPVQKHLKQQFDIESVNLSKQSTGLAYPSFFDWPLTIEKTLKQHPEIAVMVVFLGPNDPWDFPNPKGGKYLEFQSAEWESVYKGRVDRILTAAEQHNVKVLWLGIPFMKKKRLDEQMRYLDNLLSSTVEKRVKWLPTAKLLSSGAEAYSDSVTINGKVVRYRSKDGIHFSTDGQKLLSDYVMAHIKVQAE